jgi:ABC-type branched-subunit amino acid transport system substrate-binding protein
MDKPFVLFCRYIKKQEHYGETGKVSFDESGDRMNAEYHIVNVYPGGGMEVVGQYLYSKVMLNLILDKLQLF